MTTARPITSLNPRMNTAPRHEQQREVTSDGVVQPRGHQRVLDEVRRGVGGRERDGDDEARRGESEQDEHDGLALPAGEERLEHQDAALAVRAGFGHAVVHRQRADERQQDEHQAWRAATAAPPR